MLASSGAAAARSEHPARPVPFPSLVVGAVGVEVVDALVEQGVVGGRHDRRRSECSVLSHRKHVEGVGGQFRGDDQVLAVGRVGHFTDSVVKVRRVGVGETEGPDLAALSDEEVAEQSELRHRSGAARVHHRYQIAVGGNRDGELSLGSDLLQPDQTRAVNHEHRNGVAAGIGSHQLGVVIYQGEAVLAGDRVRRSADGGGAEAAGRVTAGEGDGAVARPRVTEHVISTGRFRFDEERVTGLEGFEVTIVRRRTGAEGAGGDGETENERACRRGPDG